MHIPRPRDEQARAQSFLVVRNSSVVVQETWAKKIVSVGGCVPAPCQMSEYLIFGKHWFSPLHYFKIIASSFLRSTYPSISLVWC